MTTAAAGPSPVELPVPSPPSVSPRTVLLILLLSLGWFAVGSALRLFQVGQVSGFQLEIRDWNLAVGLVYEVIVGLALVLFLRRRGWRLEHLTLPFAGMDLGRALGVWLLALLACWAVVVGLAVLAPIHAADIVRTRMTGNPSALLIAAVVLINPLYEELVYLGFVPAVFRTSPPWQVLLLSTALRVSVHTYQGLVSLVVILPWGLLFTAYYLRTRRLWPVVLAHALQDALGLSLLSSHAG